MSQSKKALRSSSKKSKKVKFSDVLKPQTVVDVLKPQTVVVGNEECQVSCTKTGKKDFLNHVRITSIKNGSESIGIVEDSQIKCVAKCSPLSRKRVYTLKKPMKKTKKTKKKVGGRVTMNERFFHDLK